MRLVTPEQMREMDRRTIEEVGIPGLVLMERAALGAVQALSDYLPEDRFGRIGILCGGGNNGGDGIAMGRMLASEGYEPMLVLLGSPDSLSPDAASQLEIARHIDLDIIDFSGVEADELDDHLEALPDALVWIDALLGTGLDRPVEGSYATAIDFLNRQPLIFAVDIPSGIHGDSGQVMGVAVHADVTSTFGAVKLGQTIDPGRKHCGDLRVVDIGIPRSVELEVGFEAELLDESWTFLRMSPREEDTHKGDSGKLLLLAGSHEKTGAALLAARGALASGAGLLTVGTHERVVERIAPVVNEAMAAHMLADTRDEHALERLLEFLPGVDAVGAGPGMGTSDGARAALDALLSSSVPALVCDADSLTILSGFDDYNDLAAYCEDGTAVLTPHPGEMARLCDCTIKDVLAAPVDQTRTLARRTGAYVVLKTGTTIIAAPDGRLAINSTGNPGMATGGMGDVLTGMITARLAERTEPPFEAVCLAVHAHGLAGDTAATTTGERGLSAGALVDELPTTWRDLES
ncbi:MAG: NAD(P)H-hydrate dehydratase [Myxococcota bacterium]